MIFHIQAPPPALAAPSEAHARAREVPGPADATHGRGVILRAGVAPGTRAVHGTSGDREPSGGCLSLSIVGGFIGKAILWMDEIHFAPLGNHGKPLFVGKKQGNHHSRVS